MLKVVRVVPQYVHMELNVKPHGQMTIPRYHDTLRRRDDYY
jgi:hypothetical protein